ncbi:MAG: hypothetical protein H7Y11_14175, partial [Armatimonadetes bacterium]|nr:hypothetical protein [Anaerolineae bacterium]
GIGVIGSTAFQYKTEQALTTGGTMTAQDYTLRFDNFEQGVADDGRELTIANVTVLRDGAQIAQLRPRIDFFPSSEMSMTIAGAHSTLENDFYVLLSSYDTITGTARFWVYINPLVNLVWYGGILLMLGTFISAWSRDAQPAPARLARPAVPTSGAVAAS